MALLHIYYGTVTGNSESLAIRAKARAEAEGWETRLHNLCDVKSADLASSGRALFIASTWGDGEPPDAACAFFEELSQSTADLSGLHYAVLGLGDSNYPNFNAFARNLDERLNALGAQRVAARVEADLEFEDTYAQWEDAIFAQLGKP
ncbi:MAG: flavodoxin domain-containing protein [Puniceicoccales bacterium]|nr:flavodoxin domain-containing protein [Puniceicoccales bacterium]